MELRGIERDNLSVYRMSVWTRQVNRGLRLAQEMLAKWTETMDRDAQECLDHRDKSGSAAFLCRKVQSRI